MEEVKFSFSTKGKKYRVTSPDKINKSFHINTKNTGSCYVEFVDGIATIYYNRKLADYFREIGFSVEIIDN